MWVSKNEYYRQIQELRDRINRLEAQSIIYGDERNITATFPYDVRHWTARDTFTAPELVTAILRYLKIKPQKVQAITDIVMVKTEQEKEK